MPRSSPTVEGFRAAIRRPLLTWAEIAWRWTVGAIAWGLAGFFLIEYIDTLPVSRADSFLLATRHPAFIARALTHILRGSLNRTVLAALIAALSLAILWIFAASIGRFATVRGLCQYFRSNFAETAGIETPSESPAPETAPAKLYIASNSRSIRGLLDLNFLRVSVALALFLALGGSGILASFVSTNAQPRPGLAIMLFFFLAGLVFAAGWTLNWWLSLAEVFAVRNGEDALSAVGSAISFSRKQTGPVLAVSIWIGLAHLVAFSIGSTVASFPLAFLPIISFRLVIACLILVASAYFAVADWLYIARLAGYVCIIEMPDVLAVAPSAPVPLPDRPAIPLESSIDRDEPILSDLSNLALES
jgi:hypothetical protein